MNKTIFKNITLIFKVNEVFVWKNTISTGMAFWLHGSNYVNVFRKLEWIKNGELKRQIFKDLLNLFRGIIFILISASYSNKMSHLLSTPDTLKYSVSFYCLSPKLQVCLWDPAYIFSGSEGECSMTFCCVCLETFHPRN